MGTEGEVTVVVEGDVLMLQGRKKEEEEEEEGGGRGVVGSVGVEPDSGGVARAGFDSSHQPFLQQRDGRKSNRQEETLSTKTTTTG